MVETAKKGGSLKRLVIDARESGTSTGLYVDKLIEYLYRLSLPYEVSILTKTPRIDYIKDIAPKFSVLNSDHKEFTFAEQIAFLSQLRRLKPDLVHFAMPQQPIFYQGKVVTTIHDLTTVRFRNPAKNRLIFTAKQQVYKLAIKKAARKSAYVITPSNFVKYDVAQYASIPINKITVTYLAADKIDEDPQPVVQLANKKFLLYVGRALPHKNLQRLVRAFAALKQTHPDLLLVFGGKIDDNYRLLRQYADRIGVRGVVFTDFVSGSTLRWLYENAAVYVFPSRSEGFGFPGLEAMLYNLPIVSSNATCLPEIYKDGALYFDPLNTDDMARTIGQVLDDSSLSKQLAQKGREVARQYSWQRTAEQTLEVYRRALSNEKILD